MNLYTIPIQLIPTSLFTIKLMRLDMYLFFFHRKSNVNYCRSQDRNTMKTVVVVGAGFFGISSANQLVKQGARVILVTPSKYSYILPAGPRVPVYNKPDGAIFPLEEALSKNVEVVMGSVDFFDKDKVRVGSLDIEFDVLILATGSRWSEPIGTTMAFGDDYATYFKLQHDKLQKARNIVLIGGGMNNCELAGELMDKYADELSSDEKKITLVQTSRYLLPDNEFYGDAFRKKVTQFFEDSIVDLKINTRASEVSEDSKFVHLSTGEVIEADLVITSIGHNASVPKNSIMGFCNERGFVKVNETFQSTEVRNIFAIGDVNDFNFKGLILREKWVNVLVHNIMSFVNNDNSEMTKAPQMKGHAPCIITLGRHRGIGQLPSFLGTWSLPNWTCVWAKSANLFLDKPKSYLYMP